MRIVFMGTPTFAAKVLAKLVDAHEVVAVVSQPDRAKDRKGNAIFTPVKEFALSKNIPVFQYEKIKLHVDELKAFCADIFVTAAYGQILSQEIIDIPRFGIVNVHASLLPKYRGSSPIQAAILNGDEETGVTIMQTEIGMDTGDILSARKVKIGGMNTGELSDALADVGGELLLETLSAIESGALKPQKQDNSLAVSCKKISKDAALLNWESSSQELYNTIRALNPNPVAYTLYKAERIKIYEAECVDCKGEAGKILCADRKNGLVIACGEGALRIKKLQAPGKKIMSESEYLNGNKLAVGDYFGK
ncbi:MAG: methionyl-tRNA formyltransferase [Clostridiales bacterium]|nr:methionyl-tRNA formyltransferase [Clostridiales bacterium]